MSPVRQIVTHPSPAIIVGMATSKVVPLPNGNFLQNPAPDRMLISIPVCGTSFIVDPLPLLLETPDTKVTLSPNLWAYAYHPLSRPSPLSRTRVKSRLPSCNLGRFIRSNMATER